MIYGYCRISRPQQNIERQHLNIIAEYPTAKLYSEVWTGTSGDRPQWIRLMKRIKKGDIIVFDSVSRMSRNAAEGIKQYDELFERGAELVFLKEPHINTATYKKALNDSLPMTGTAVDVILKAVNEYLRTLAHTQIRLAFEQSEKEVMDLRKRTSEGIMMAGLMGKRVGNSKGDRLITRKSIESKLQMMQKAKAFGGPYPDKDLIKVLGIRPNTYYKYKKELKRDIEEMGSEGSKERLCDMLEIKNKNGR